MKLHIEMTPKKLNAYIGVKQNSHEQEQEHGLKLDAKAVYFCLVKIH